MTIKEFKNEFRLESDYKYDPWGSSMNVHFQVADHITDKNSDTPIEWQYRPGLTHDIQADIEDYYYDLFKACTVEQLTAIGNLLNRYEDYLRFKGKDY